MAKLKIKHIKVYQSVKFEGAENSYFTPSQYISIRTSKPEVLIEECDNGSVIITSKLDKIRIGSANVAYIQYDMNEVEEEKGLLKKAK